MRYTVEVASNGTFWYKEGTEILHREDGPAIEQANGLMCWYVNGKLHREDGPAITCADARACWYVNGKLHREDGPAIEDADGSKQWYLNGESLSEQQFLERTAPAKELTVAEIEQLLGYRVKIVK